MYRPSHHRTGFGPVQYLNVNRTMQQHCRWSFLFCQHQCSASYRRSTPAILVLYYTASFGQRRYKLSLSLSNITRKTCNTPDAGSRCIFLHSPTMNFGQCKLLSLRVNAHVLPRGRREGGCVVFLVHITERSRIVVIVLIKPPSPRAGNSMWLQRPVDGWWSNCSRHMRHR